jgi:hypothetical protein
VYEGFVEAKSYKGTVVKVVSLDGSGGLRRSVDVGRGPVKLFFWIW